MATNDPKIEIQTFHTQSRAARECTTRMHSSLHRPPIVETDGTVFSCLRQARFRDATSQRRMRSFEQRKYTTHMLASPVCVVLATLTLTDSRRSASLYGLTSADHSERQTRRLPLRGRLGACVACCGVGRRGAAWWRGPCGMTRTTRCTHPEYPVAPPSPATSSGSKIPSLPSPAPPPSPTLCHPFVRLLELTPAASRTGPPRHLSVSGDCTRHPGAAPALKINTPAPHHRTGMAPPIPFPALALRHRGYRPLSRLLGQCAVCLALEIRLSQSRPMSGRR